MVKSVKTILVTGSGGFIGINITEFFKDEYQILEPKHQELDLLSQDVVDDFFQNNQIDYVIHGANIGGNRTREDGPEIVEENLRMFFNLTKNQENFKKLIHLGSGAEYSKTEMPPMVTENDFGSYIPTDYYGFSKYVISKYIENTDKIYCLRLFGVFGPGEDYRYKFISNSILKNMLKMPVTIMQNVYFDWLYIEDLMHIIDYFLKNNPSSSIFNITTGKKIDLISIVKLINDLSDFQSEIKVVNPGMNREYSGDNHKLTGEIGDYNFMNMKEAIKKLMDFYHTNCDDLDLNIIQEDPFASRCRINRG
jgi:GDP-L-fucose synthase